MPEWVQFLIGQGIMAAGLYGAIRADLREALTRAGNAEESAGEAHKRIDDILMKGKI